MKSPTLLTLLIILLTATASFSQVPGEQKGWPSAERYAFIQACVGSAKANFSVDTARFYCYCMQEKTEAMYPNIEDAAKVTEEDMSSPTWQKQIKACLNGYWGTEERTIFLDNCVSSATKGGMETDKAQSYCECMLYKVEVHFPNPLDAAALDDKMLKTPEWQKILKGCIDF
ncbi:MAG: hypothetical protein IPP73_01050 [Chitinophagaceae bacterium]|nr:hypothetical protein [Chitinophagaceae bacterium]